MQFEEQDTVSVLLHSNLFYLSQLGNFTISTSFVHSKKAVYQLQFTNGKYGSTQKPQFSSEKQ